MAQTKKITLPLRDYQPSKAELEDSQDMPGTDMKRLRKAFFEPVEIKREPPQVTRH